MSALSDVAENLLLDWLMTAGAATRPTAWYVSLWNGAVGDGETGTELTGNGYARQSVTFGAAASGTTSNTNAPTFTASGGAWSEASYVGIHSAVSGTGNLLWHGQMTAAKTLADGESLEFAIGDIDLTLA